MNKKRSAKKSNHEEELTFENIVTDILNVPNVSKKDLKKKGGNKRNE